MSVPLTGVEVLIFLPTLVAVGVLVSGKKKKKKKAQRGAFVFSTRVVITTAKDMQAPYCRKLKSRIATVTLFSCYSQTDNRQINNCG